MTVFHGAPIPQYGRGLGSTFRSGGRTILPAVKTVARRLGGRAKRAAHPMAKKAVQHAIRAGVNVVRDVVQGQNFKKATKWRAQEALRGVKASALEGLQRFVAPPAKKRRMTARKKSKPRRRMVKQKGGARKRRRPRHRHDIFA